MSKPLTARRWCWIMAAYAALFLAALIVCPFIGRTPVDAGEQIRSILAGRPDFGGILLQLRLPRVLLALLAGGTLALVGAAFQVILRNALADPFTLGITGGSAVGAVVALSAPGLAISLGPFSTLQLFAFAGAAASLGLVYAVARRPHGMSMNTLLLAGVTVSILSAGVIMFIRYLADPYNLAGMDRWMMGGLDIVGFRDLGPALPLLLPGIALLLMQAAALNHLSLGEDMAAGHGVEVAQVQRLTFIGSGLATAAVVSLAGPIGFVGLIIPHAVRRISGHDQRVVLPASFLLGGAFLAACDTAGRTLFHKQEIPVGVITAIVGGVLFIRILLGRRR